MIIIHSLFSLCESIGELEIVRLLGGKTASASFHEIYETIPFSNTLSFFLRVCDYISSGNFARQ